MKEPVAFRAARPGRRQNPRVAVIAVAVTTVADIFSLTYCQLQDVHPKTLGYNVVAGLVVATLPRVHREPPLHRRNPDGAGRVLPKGDGPVGGSPFREMKDPPRPCTM
jgi:hypothetical protein